MHLPRCSLGLLALAASSSWHTVTGTPLEKFVRPAVEPMDTLRLIKTSPSDPGTWMSPEDIYEQYMEKKIGFIDITDVSAEELAILSTPDGEESSPRLKKRVTYPTTLSHQTQANPLVALATTTGPQSWLLTLSNFQNRYYTSTYGVQAATWLYNQLVTLAAPNPAITVSYFTHTWSQSSIIVKIPGSTSTNLVIVGAHFDGVGSGSTRRPAADDNGSGTVVLMEALRVLASQGFAPRDTIEFHFYAAEEPGLLGSQAIFSNYRTSGKTVLAFVNQDMAGYSPSGKISVYTDYVDASLTAYVRLSAQTYGGAGAPTSDACGYGCSDHASARSNGFPASYVCDEVMATSDPYIHTASDTYSTIMWPAILRHSKFTIGFLVEASYL